MSFAFKNEGVASVKATSEGASMLTVVGRDRVARALALAGATMCMYFVDSRFQEGPSAGLMPGVAELLAAGLFLSGLFLCRSENKSSFPACKEPSASRKGNRAQSAKLDLPRSTER